MSSQICDVLILFIYLKLFNFSSHLLSFFSFLLRLRFIYLELYFFARYFTECPSVSDFISAVSLCVQMIQKHGNAQRAFEESCIAVFAENHLSASKRAVSINLLY